MKTTGLDRTIGKRAGRPQKTSERGWGGTVFALMPGPCRDLAPLPGADEHLPRQRCQHRCPEPSCTPVTLPDLQSISTRGPGTVFKVGTGHCPSTAPFSSSSWSYVVIKGRPGKRSPSYSSSVRSFVHSFIHHCLLPRPHVDTEGFSEVPRKRSPPSRSPKPHGGVTSKGTLSILESGLSPASPLIPPTAHGPSAWTSHAVSP